MLKPADPRMAPSGPHEERPVGELVHQLIEHGKAYARAEIGLVKAIATAKAGALAMPAGLLVLAMFMVGAAFTALAVGVTMVLATFLGPLAGGFVGFLIFAAIAGGLAWFAYSKIRSSL